MKDLEHLHFQQLKKDIQDEFLKKNTPSEDNIELWKGIDIVFFQEDLRKRTKYSISERSFYNFFKNKNNTKLPRIDTLNLLCQYVGYKSWHEFKKDHLFKNEVLADLSSDSTKNTISLETNTEISRTSEDILGLNINQKSEILNIEELDNNLSNNFPNKSDVKDYVKKRNKFVEFLVNYLWVHISFLLGIVLFITIFYENLFIPTYTYCFYDEDKNLPIKANLEVFVIKENESPIQYNIANGQCFKYSTRDTKLKLIVSSAYYKTDTIYRNLENAPENEMISLKPDEYAIMLHYYSNSMKDLKRKRMELNQLISDNAQIYQVFDNDVYARETLTKEKYITLLTLPSTSLENLTVLETKMKNKKIIKIKFKIESNEK